MPCLRLQPAACGRTSTKYGGTALVFNTTCKALMSSEAGISFALPRVITEKVQSRGGDRPGKCPVGTEMRTIIGQHLVNLLFGGYS